MKPKKIKCKKCRYVFILIREFETFYGNPYSGPETCKKVKESYCQCRKNPPTAIEEGHIFPEMNPEDWCWSGKT